MFIVSMKTSRKKLVSYICIFLIFLAALLVWISGLMRPIKKFASGGTAQSVSQQAKGKKDTTADGNTARIEYLKKFGWTVNEEAVEIKEVAVPFEFSDVYKAYNEIQKAQGFDLTAYMGKTCKRYTYVVNNYPGHTDDVRANILMDGEKIIGGDICSIMLNGFMHGFKLPQE